MIDPLGPDPTDPALPARQVGEMAPKIELPEPPKPTRPKVRFANYDRPEALIRRASLEDLPSPGRKPADTDDPLPASPQPTEPLKAIPDPSHAPPKTALARPIPPLHKSSKFQRAIGVAKTVLPLVGKMLPLLEGNVVSAAANLLTPQPVEVDLKPLEEQIARLEADQRALSFHTTEQKRALRRLQDEFATLQEAVEKSAEQQAEIAEHLAKLVKRTASFNRLVVILLLVFILFTAFLCIRVAYIIRF